MVLSLLNLAVRSDKDKILYLELICIDVNGRIQGVTRVDNLGNERRI